MDQLARREDFDRRRRALVAEQRFYDEELMVGPPDCSEAAFRQPLLRRCPFAPSSISWIARLDGGLDGLAWKVMVGDQGPFVIKVVRPSCSRISWLPLETDTSASSGT
jgi:hypothetical protein